MVRLTTSRIARPTPAKIGKAAADEGIAIISLADHNEVANIPAAQAAGAEHGVFVVPGVELSTPEGHLLCYVPTYDAMERFFNRLPHRRMVIAGGIV